MTTSDLLVERYGAPSRGRRTALLAVVAAVVLLFGGWLSWTIWEQAHPEVASGNLTFDIPDGRTATARFTVDVKDTATGVRCTLNAYAEDHTLVGAANFTPEPDAGGEVSHTVATSSQATAVELIGCTADGQSRPR